MADGRPEELDDLIGVDEASRLLEVAPDRVQVMVDEGLLAPAEGGDGQQFVRAEVLAVREIGG
jgi:hypothetical protein